MLSAARQWPQWRSGCAAGRVRPRVPPSWPMRWSSCAHRLLGHGYAIAAADAQDSVRRAGEILAASGPIGPYTSINDAARYVTAVGHMAAIQAGLGLVDAGPDDRIAAGHARATPRNGLEQRLEAQTAIWALLCGARAALVSGDIAAANAYADAALARLADLIFGTTLTLPISPWTSTGWPPTAGGRRAGPMRRCSTCTQPSRDMTMWSAGVSRSLRGSVRHSWNAWPSRSSACVGTWQTGWPDAARSRWDSSPVAN